MKIIVLLYIRIHFLLNNLGLHLRGLGIIQRLLRKQFLFEAFAKKFFYDPSIEGSYDYLLIGKSNEPETHLFLDKILENLDTANFIDVGASVGEFVFAISRYKNVPHIYAFEPRPDCAEVLRKNAKINHDERVKVFENAVDDTGVGELLIHLNSGGTSSGIYNQTDKDFSRTIKVKPVTLDMTLPVDLQNPVLLIDVEGAETLVLKGGKAFIEKNYPLIIFEYNSTSKQHFHLDDIKEILGEGYEIFRLKADGNLDQDFSNSWNCVAIPENSIFMELLSKSIT